MLNLKTIYDNIAALVLNTATKKMTTVGPVSVTVTTHGTSVPISATALNVVGFDITADAGNSGKMYVGGSAVDSSSAASVPLSASAVFSRGPQGGYYYDLHEIYIDADSDGDSVWVTYYTA